MASLRSPAFTKESLPSLLMEESEDSDGSSGSVEDGRVSFSTPSQMNILLQEEVVKYKGLLQSKGGSSNTLSSLTGACTQVQVATRSNEGEEPDGFLRASHARQALSHSGEKSTGFE